MCNNSLFEDHGAENLSGLKHITEDAGRCGATEASNFKIQISNKLQISKSMPTACRQISKANYFVFGCLCFDIVWKLVIGVWDFRRFATAVGEHSLCVEAGSVRACGAQWRENVGMSNRKADEKSAPRKSKVSSATKIGGGWGGPKAMAKAEADGQPVNIPALPLCFDGGTRCSRSSVLMVWHSWSRMCYRQIRNTVFNYESQSRGEF